MGLLTIAKLCAGGQSTLQYVMRTQHRVGLTKVKTFAQTLAKQLNGGEILALIGPLGSGKTTFTQALGQALGVKENILSPTFILMHEFATKKKNAEKQILHLIHLDLYRTADFKEIKALGLTESWGQPNTITVIEWADKIKNKLPARTIYIHLHRDVK